MFYILLVFLIISGKFSYSNSFVHVKVKLLFYCLYSKKCKHSELAFLTFMSASEHVLFDLGVDPTARDTGEGRGSDLVTQVMPFAVSCGLVAVHVPSLHKSNIIKPRKTSSKCYRVCH